MASIEDTLLRMKRKPNGMRFNDLCKVRDHFFGKPRKSGTSHRVYKTPWPANPRVNIQDSRGKAKAYPIRQVLAAIERLESSDGQEN